MLDLRHRVLLMMPLPRIERLPVHEGGLETRLGVTKRRNALPKAGHGIELNAGTLHQYTSVPCPCCAMRCIMLKPQFPSPGTMPGEIKTNYCIEHTPGVKLAKGSELQEWHEFTRDS